VLEYEKVYVIYISNINDNRCLKKKQHFALGSVSWHVLFFITFKDLLLVLKQSFQRGEKKSNIIVFVLHVFQFNNFSQYVYGIIL